MGLQDGYGNRVVVTGKWTDATDGRMEQEAEEGRRKSGDDQFQLIGNFSPVNRTDGDGGSEQ